MAVRVGKKKKKQKVQAKECYRTQGDDFFEDGGEYGKEPGMWTPVKLCHTTLGSHKWPSSKL